jgi:hypothetical protein
LNLFAARLNERDLLEQAAFRTALAIDQPAAAPFRFCLGAARP